MAGSSSKSPRYRYLFGIDEAGLGPLLGPLTIGCAGFRLSEALPAEALSSLDLWAILEGAVGREPKERSKRPVVCDSKKLYTPARGVKALEEELLGWAQLAGLGGVDFAGFYEALCPQVRDKLERYPWYAEVESEFPLACDLDRARLRAQPVRRALQAADIELSHLSVLPVLEGELNRLIARTRNKSAAEFDAIGHVLSGLWRTHRHIAVVCDRQGGRERYSGALSRLFPEAVVSVLTETPTAAAYELVVAEEADRPSLWIAFLEGGESVHLPVALASMAAKYVRELLMHRFNLWFSARKEGLKPTAGYYQDGRRFLAETEELRRSLRIDDSQLIRAR